MSFVKDINQDQFVQEVIEKSKETPVIVDFWAPWCGPCKQLTPTLEKVVKDKNGKVILVKINVDENQGIAAQLNIQSIPTVYGFVDGKPIDAFQGAQPESKIEIMVNKLIDSAPGNEIPKILIEADDLFKEKRFEEAMSLYEKLVSLDPGNPKIIVGLIRCLIQLNRINDAKELVESLDESLSDNEEIIKIKKLLIPQVNETANSINDLKINLKDDPENKEIRFELANTFLGLNEIENGFEELLILFEKDPRWNEEAAKKKLLEYFDLLGFSDPNVIEARKKLSSLMFK